MILGQLRIGESPPSCAALVFVKVSYAGQLYHVPKWMNVWISSKQPFPPAVKSILVCDLTPSPGAGKESVSSVCHVPLCTKSTHGHSIEHRLRRVTKVFMRNFRSGNYKLADQYQALSTKILIMMSLNLPFPSRKYLLSLQMRSNKHKCQFCAV